MTTTTHDSEPMTNDQSMRPQMIYDKREIKSVFEVGLESQREYIVSEGGITRITLYEEKGPADWVTFAAVWCGDSIEFRLPMATLGISYEVTP